MSITAMKQALEALVGYELVYGSDEKDRDAITALRQAIEQAEKQEPVADLVECGNCHEGLSDMDHVCKKCLGAGWVRNPDTTPQPQREWVGLTDEEVNQLWNWVFYSHNEAPQTPYSFAKAVEAKLRSKNT